MRRRVRTAVGYIASIGVRRRLVPVAASAVLCLFLANCADNSKIDPRYGVAASARLVDPGDPVPKGGGVYRSRRGAAWVALANDQVATASSLAIGNGAASSTRVTGATNR